MLSIVSSNTFIDPYRSWLEKTKEGAYAHLGNECKRVHPSAKPRNPLAPFRRAPGLERIAGEGLAPDANGSTRLLWLGVKSVDT